MFSLLNACSQPDPLLGRWNLSGGSTIVLTSNSITVLVEGIDPMYNGETGSEWSSTWKRDGEVIIIQPPDFAAASGTRSYRIVKLNEGELILKAIEDATLLTASRAG
jgi:hypothetical protein